MRMVLHRSQIIDDFGRAIMTTIMSVVLDDDSDMFDEDDNESPGKIIKNVCRETWHRKDK